VFLTPHGKPICKHRDLNPVAEFLGSMYHLDPVGGVKETVEPPKFLSGILPVLGADIAFGVAHEYFHFLPP
jgi:hypothetical protein